MRLRGAGPREDVISAVGLKYTTSGSRFGACSSSATFYLLWLRLDVKVGFCVLRLAFSVWCLPQRGVEHETTNPRAGKQGKNE